MTELSLAHGLSFDDLYQRDGLVRLDRVFVENLKTRELALFNRLMAGRENPDGLDEKEHSELLVDLGPFVESFVGELFGLEAELGKQRAERDRLNPIYACKLQFVRRRAAKAFKPDELAAADGRALRRALEDEIGETLNELNFSIAVMGWLEDEEANAGKLESAAKFAAWATLSKDGKARYRRARCSTCQQRLMPPIWSPSRRSR